MKEQIKETAGELRLEAAIAKSHENLTDEDEYEYNPTTFSVGFKARGQKSYEEDKDFAHGHIQHRPCC